MKTSKPDLKIIKIKVEKTANNDLIKRVTSVGPSHEQSQEGTEILLEAKLATNKDESGRQKSYRLK